MVSNTLTEGSLSLLSEPDATSPSTVGGGMGTTADWGKRTPKLSKGGKKVLQNEELVH